MQINPYLFFDSNCEAAFKFYEKVLGGKIELMLRNSEGPPEMRRRRTACRTSCTPGCHSMARC